jgi:hypothetical protein
MSAKDTEKTKAQTKNMTSIDDLTKSRFQNINPSDQKTSP